MTSLVLLATAFSPNFCSPHPAHKLVVSPEFKRQLEERTREKVVVQQKRAQEICVALELIEPSSFNPSSLKQLLNKTTSIKRPEFETKLLTFLKGPPPDYPRMTAHVLTVGQEMFNISPGALFTAALRDNSPTNLMHHFLETSIYLHNPDVAASLLRHPAIKNMAGADLTQLYSQAMLSDNTAVAHYFLDPQINPQAHIIQAMLKGELREGQFALYLKKNAACNIIVFMMLVTLILHLMPHTLTPTR